MAKTNFDSIQVEDSAIYDGDGNQVVGGQESAIADITPAADGTTAGTAVNAILAVLRSHGLIATS